MAAAWTASGGCSPTSGRRWAPRARSRGGCSSEGRAPRAPGGPRGVTAVPETRAILDVMDAQGTWERKGAQRPVGIFDSGVGGLSVAREIRQTLGAEDLVYVADTAYCPYGDRAVEEVRRRALAVGRYLEASGARLVIVACNTASGAALEDLRAVLSVPVVGLEPALKTAVARTRTRRVGVMATSGTLRSERFSRLLRAHADGTEVVAPACPRLAHLIAEGHLDDQPLAARLGEL